MYIHVYIYIYIYIYIYMYGFTHLCFIVGGLIKGGCTGAQLGGRGGEAYIMLRYDVMRNGLKKYNFGSVG